MMHHRMDAQQALPPWPSAAPSSGVVVLRAVREEDAAMAMELSTDTYVPQIGSLPAHATEAQALDWVGRQQNRHREGAGFSFTIAEAQTDRPLGHCGLWLRDMPSGRASAGYSIRPSARGRGLASEALTALTTFAWSIEQLHRVELYIEAWNVGSQRAAERAGYLREGLLRSHQEIGGQRRDMLLYAQVRSPPLISPQRP